MKIFLAVAALTISGPAFAQDVATNAGPQQVDARGIPVINDAPNMPAGLNQPVTIPQGAQVTLAPPSQFFQTRPATMTYPPCERGQTDRCVQAYVDQPRQRRARRRR